MFKKWFLTLIVLTMVPLANASQPRPVAWIITQSSYQTSGLSQLSKQGEDLQQALQKLGYLVTRKQDLGHASLAKALEAFAQAAKKKSGSILYYMGHAMQYQGENYLIPVDVVVAHGHQLPSKGLAVDPLLKALDDAEGPKLVVLDSHWANPFARFFRVKEPGLAHMRAPFNGVVAFAAAPNQGAPKNQQQPSLYTQGFVSQLGQQATLSELLMAVRRGVVNAAGKKQVPWSASELLAPMPFQLIKDEQVGTTAVSEQVEAESPSSPLVEKKHAQKIDNVVEVPKRSMGMQSLPIQVDPITGLEFVFIPGGCLQQPVDGEKEKKECVTGFWLSRYEITNEAYLRFQPTHRSGYYKGWSLNSLRQPAVNLSLIQAQKFAQWLSLPEVQRPKFTLPTQLQWRYAAQQGESIRMADLDQGRCANANLRSSTIRTLPNKPWVQKPLKKRVVCRNGLYGSGVVGRFGPDRMGLWDMVGNVREWVTASEQATATTAVVQGGGWQDHSAHYSDAQSIVLSKDEGYEDVGFRLVMQP
ncbi:caspase family protein [Magnetococcus sp. PR-3]|uniref:caspase family protein n=1 Tax=Magnetococcus sp. PR-3 TaxID=3120355 RepID=UPI002FCE11E0